jgi:hypothetical protein
MAGVDLQGAGRRGQCPNADYTAKSFWQPRRPALAHFHEWRFFGGKRVKRQLKHFNRFPTSEEEPCYSEGRDASMTRHDLSIAWPIAHALSYSSLPPVCQRRPAEAHPPFVYVDKGACNLRCIRKCFLAETYPSSGLRENHENSAGN